MQNMELASIRSESAIDNIMDAINETPDTPRIYHTIVFKQLKATVVMIDKFFLIQDYDPNRGHEAVSAIGMSDEDDLSLGNIEFCDIKILGDVNLFMTALRIFNEKFINYISEHAGTVQIIESEIEPGDVLNMVQEIWRLLDEKNNNVVH